MSSHDDDQNIDADAFDDVDIPGSDMGDEIEGDYDEDEFVNEDDEPVAVPDEDDAGGNDEQDVDTRHLNGTRDDTDAEPNIDPSTVTVTGAVDTTVKAQFNGGDGGEDVQGIADGAPDARDDATLYARVVDVTDQTHGPEDGPGQRTVTLTVADETGMTRINIDTMYSALVDTVTGDVEPGDEVTLTVLAGSDKNGYEYEATRHTKATVVESDEYPAGYYLEESSKLDNVAGMYRDADVKAVAWSQIADALIETLNVSVLYDDDDPTWWMYIDDETHDKHGVWMRDGRSRLKTALDDVMPERHNQSHDRREILKNVENRARVEPAEFAAGVPNDIDLKWMVGVRNGVIDLRTGELHDHGPQWRLQAKLDTEYRPDEYDGTLGDGLDWFLNDVCKTGDDRSMCLAMAAHSLMRHHNIKSAFPILGPSNSGKSKWHGAVKRMLGRDNTKTMSFESFAAGEGFSTGRVRRVHAVLDDDAAAKKIHDLDFFRAVTGGEEVNVNEKYEKLADYQPYATVSWLSNDPAILAGANSGVKSRIYPVVMPHRYTADDGDGHRDKIPESDLDARIYTDEEIEALLVAAAQRAGEMFEAGDVESERTETERWKIYRWHSDTAHRYITECLTQETGALMRKDAAYEVYVRYCRTDGIDPMNRSQFWTAVGNSEMISYESGRYDGDQRAVGHVMFDEDALDHMPEWVEEYYEGEIETGIKTNAVDRITALDDLGKSRCIVEADVVSRMSRMTSGGSMVSMLVSDGNAEVELIEFDNDDSNVEMDTSGVYSGDTVRVERGQPSVRDGSLQILVDDHASLSVKSPGPNGVEPRTGDDKQEPAQASDEEADADGDAGDVELRNAVRDTVNELEDTHDKGAPFEDVRDRIADEHGINDDKIEYIIEKNRHAGEVYEPSEGHLRAT